MNVNIDKRLLQLTPDTELSDEVWSGVIEKRRKWMSAYLPTLKSQRLREAFCVRRKNGTMAKLFEPNGGVKADLDLSLDTPCWFIDDHRVFVPLPDSPVRKASAQEYQDGTAYVSALVPGGWVLLVLTIKVMEDKSSDHATTYYEEVQAVNIFASDPVSICKETNRSMRWLWFQLQGLGKQIEAAHNERGASIASLNNTMEQESLLHEVLSTPRTVLI